MKKITYILIGMFCLTNNLYPQLIEYPPINPTPADLPNMLYNNFASLYNPFSAMSLGSSKDFTPASPEAASLGLYGQIPVGNYTGVAEISIPIYEIKYKELSVPVSISYHTSALKPDLLPGPVGLGWSLNAGGCITRVVKGNPDFQPIQIFNEVTGIRVGFDIRRTKEWADNDYLTNEYLYKPFCTPINTMEPDIFYFNFNEHSGSFYVDEDTVFRAQSREGHSYKVTMFRDYRVDTGHWDISAFHVVDEKGTTYQFEEMELTRHVKIDNDSILNSDFDPIVLPTAWYLTSMKSPNGYKIDFRYKNDTLSMVNRFADLILYQYPSDNFLTSPYNFRYEDSEKLTHIYCKNLVGITAPNGKLDFSLSTSNQLFYNFLDSYYPVKTDKMSVKNNQGEVLKSVSFDYTENVSSRLKLNQLSVTDVGKNPFFYKFEYNPGKLPEYNSWKTDLYGFYNGKELFEGIALERYTHTVRTNPDYIKECKTPDFNFSQAEILTKITYPTGGYTCFEYEPHDYSKEYLIPETEVFNNSRNKTTGGIRVKKVTDYESTGKILNEKNYRYIKNYTKGGTLSSGVLAYTPQFTEWYKGCKIWMNNGANSYKSLNEFFHWSSNPVYALMDTRGNHVTYSEVTVEEKEGYTTYAYKNYDNGYQDHPFMAAVSGKFVASGVNVDLTKYDERTSMELERGQVISENVYDIDKNLLKETSYTYNDDPDRFKQCIRFLRHNPTILQQAGRYTSYKLEAGYIYTYFPYLKRKVETEYLNIPVTRTTEYSYDGNYNLPKQVMTTGSNDEQVTTTYTYAHEGLAASAVKDSMVARRLLAFPVEEEQKVNSDRIVLVRKYNSGLSADNPGLIAVNELSIKTNSFPATLQTVYAAYDATGNPLYQQTLQEGNVCYIWSYDKEFLVAKIMGATLAEVKARLGETEYARWGKLSCPTDQEIAGLRNKLVLLDAQVTTYTYKPMVGMTSETLPNGLTTYYEYDGLGRLKTVRDHQRNIVRSYDYHYQTQN